MFSAQNPETLKAGNLLNRVSRCAVCYRLARKKKRSVGPSFSHHLRSGRSAAQHQQQPAAAAGRHSFNQGGI